MPCSSIAIQVTSYNKLPNQTTFKDWFFSTFMIQNLSIVITKTLWNLNHIQLFPVNSVLSYHNQRIWNYYDNFSSFLQILKLIYYSSKCFYLGRAHSLIQKKDVLISVSWTTSFSNRRNYRNSLEKIWILIKSQKNTIFEIKGKIEENNKILHIKYFKYP